MTSSTQGEETFSEIQALQDMEDARIGRSRALQAKAGLAALNEPFCNRLDHVSLEAERDALKAALTERDEQLARMTEMRDAFAKTIELLTTENLTITIPRLEAAEAALTEAQADANNLALALTCWDSEHPATCDCPACSVLIKALARHAALHTPTGAGE